MLLIADGGSTKVDWALVNEDKPVKKIQTAGLNPYFLSDAEMLSLLEKDLLPFIHPAAVKHLFFYGAGCGSPEKSSRLQSVLSQFFPSADPQVSTDIQGVIHAIGSVDTFLAAILGTGANACFISHGNIMGQAPAMGYILGDEGSGAHLGKILLASYISTELPLDLRQSLEHNFYISRENILDSVYRKPAPNQYLASFCPWIAQNKNHPFIAQLVQESFQLFLKKHIEIFESYRQIPLYFYGSIAYYFADILSLTALNSGANLAHIHCSPMDGLIQYHLKSN